MGFKDWMEIINGTTANIIALVALAIALRNKPDDE